MHRIRGQLMPWKNGWLLISCAPWCEPSLIVGSRVNKPLISCLASMLTCNKTPKKATKSWVKLTYLNWTPRCKCWVIRCGSKNGNQKNTCLNEIELVSVWKVVNHPRLNSQHDWRGLCEHVIGQRIYILITNKMFHMKLHKLWRGKLVHTCFGVANCHALIMCSLALP